MNSCYYSFYFWKPFVNINSILALKESMFFGFKSGPICTYLGVTLIFSMAWLRNKQKSSAIVTLWVTATIARRAGYGISARVLTLTSVSSWWEKWFSLCGSRPRYSGPLTAYTIRLKCLISSIDSPTRRSYMLTFIANLWRLSNWRKSLISMI